MQHHRSVLLIWALLACAPAGCGGTPARTDATGSVPAATAPATTARPLATSTPKPTLPPGVTLAATLDFRPSGILAVGNVMWAEDHADTNRFYAFEPDTGKVLTKIPAERPCDLVAAYDRVWLVDLGAGALLAVDPETRTVVDTIDGDFEYACGPQAAGGAIWFAANPGFARVDVKTGTFKVTETGDGTFPAPGVTPSGDSIWGVLFGTGELVKIDIATGEVELRIPPPGQNAEEKPAAIAFDSLWSGNGILSRVYRLDPETGEIKVEIETTQPSRFLATADGLWLTSYPKGMVQRIDPKTNEVVFSVRLGGTINGITEGLGAIWVADTSSGRLYRIDPSATGMFG